MSYMFEIPAQFQAKHALGELVRYGSILKDGNTGKIVGHLQETGIAQELIGSLAAGPFAPVAAASSIAANFQLVRVTAMLEMMRALQVATLGVSVAGIGVSAIGFSLVNKKLNSISADLTKLVQEVKTGFGNLQEARLRDWEADFNGVLSRAELIYKQRIVGAEWNAIVNDLLNLAERYRVEQKFLLESDSVSTSVFDHLLQSRCLINGAAMSAVMLTEDLGRIQSLSEMLSSRLDQDFDDMSPLSLARKVTAEFGGDELPSRALPVAAQEWAEQRVSFIREAQEFAASTPVLLDTLQSRKIGYSEYVYASRDERREPIVFFSVP
jgi:hypothetical protein